MYFDIFLTIVSFITAVLFFYYGNKHKKENQNGVGNFQIILGFTWLLLALFNAYQAYGSYKFQQEMAPPTYSNEQIETLAEQTKLANPEMSNGEARNFVKKVTNK